jgi:hypothetical protein
MAERRGDHPDLREEMASVLDKLTEAMPSQATDAQREHWVKMHDLWIQNLRKLWNTADRAEITQLWERLGGDPQILAHLCADPAEAEQWMRPGSG